MSSSSSAVAWLDQLNEQQRQAVCHGEGPALVIAGPGAGKTRVLTYRVAWLLEQGIPHYAILALTFTNKAAREMKERIAQCHRQGRHLQWIGTFHSLFARILRKEGHRLGYQSNFTIYDTEDSKQLLKEIVEDLRLEEHRYRPPLLYERITALKHQKILWEDYRHRTEHRADDEAMGIPKFYRVYELYQRRLLTNNAMDFEDLLVNTWRVFRQYPEVLHTYQHQFQHILVDEFQDTDPVQYEIIRMLAGVHRNLFVVGDDAQSIYGFRGACLQNVFDFLKDFPEHTLYKLERNYRSTQTIVRAANTLIANNSQRIPKSLWTTNPKGEPIQIIETLNERDEARAIAHEVFEMIMQERRSPRHIAILYRTNAQSRALEEALRQRNIPYRIHGSVAFYQRKEIKDVLAYFRVVLNPRDEVALLRILNFPPRNLGPKTIERIKQLAQTHHQSLWDVLPRACGQLRSRQSQSLQALIALIRRFRQLAQEQDAYTVAQALIQASGIERYYRETLSVEEQYRWENIESLLSGIRQYVEEHPEHNRLADYLQYASLLTSMDEITAGQQNEAVVLMTMHMAKGLEFPCVVLAGAEDGYLPHYNSSDPEDLEEERRLFYVALTRAQHRVIITYARQRMLRGKSLTREPSPFLDELGEENVRWRRAYLAESASGQARATQASQGKLASVSEGSYPVVQQGRWGVQPSSSLTVEFHFEPDDPALLRPGMQVLHHRFGPGKVLELEGEPTPTIAVIDFLRFGKKKIMLKYARIKILKNHGGEQSQ